MNYRYHFFFMLLLICCLYAVTGCGRRNNLTEDDNYLYDYGSANVLTILASDIYRPVINEAVASLNAKWEAQGRDDILTIELTEYSWRNREIQFARLQVMLMAGQAPDIVFLDHVPWQDDGTILSHLTTGAFTDFYTLIDNCPYTNRSDFYENVLRAWEIDGRLHALPIGFGFEYVGINANLPQSIIDRFAAYDTITMHELLRIYLDLMDTYGSEYGHLNIFNPLQLPTPFRVLSHSITGFVDLENRVSNLNSNNFVALLEDWNRVFYGQSLFEYEYPSFPWRATGMVGARDLQRYALQYVFSVEDFALNPALALITQLNPYFLHYIPITDEHNRLRIAYTRREILSSGGLHRIIGGGHWAVPMISASADQNLAWEFTKHFISTFVNMQTIWSEDDQIARSAHTLITPIKRSYFNTMMPFMLEHTLSPFHISLSRIGDPGFSSEEERAQAISTAIDRLATYNEMPITPPFFIPGGIFADVLENFLRMPDGFMSAAEVAQELHNRVSLWLIE